MIRLRGALVGLALAAMMQRDIPALRAQSPQDRAGELFDQARQKMRDGRNDEACPLLEQSQKLDPAIGTLLHLGECYERLGRVASAWTMFREAASMARASSQPQREQLAEQRARRLEPGLSRLSIEVPSAGRRPDVQLLLDGVELAPERWSEPLPVDPGIHRIEARSRGATFFRTTVQITAPGTTAVRLPADEPAPSAAAPPSPPPPAPSASSQPAPSASPAPAATPAAERGSSLRQRGALAAAGLGALSLGAGAFFGFRALRLNDDSKPHCDARNTCDDDGLQARRDAITAGNLSTLFVGVGLAGVGAGVALWLTAPERSVALRLGPGVATLEGRF